MHSILIRFINVFRNLTPVNLKIKFSLSLFWLSNFILSDSDTDEAKKDSIKYVTEGNYDKAIQLLEQKIKIGVNDSQIFLYLRLVKFLKKRAEDPKIIEQTQEMIDQIEIMDKEIKSKEIYIPGDFWNKTGKHHLDLLKQYGVENFKRTVSHHYQNWFMTNLNEPQVQQIHALWHEHKSLEPWVNTIETPDHIGFNADLTYPSYPLANIQAREVYSRAASLLWEYVNHTDEFDILESLEEIETGNPLRIWRKGKLISSDLAHSVRERNKLFKTLNLQGVENKIVGELGAGHGRLAEIFGKTSNYKHFIFDITPALYVSQWYIKKIFPNEKIFEFRPFNNFEDIQEELENARFAFFTSNQIEKIPNDFLDIFINLKSLAEMPKQVVNNFLDQIGRSTREAFFSSQQITSKNPVEKEAYTKESFAMSDKWKLALDEVDDVYPIYFNQIWSKE